VGRKWIMCGFILSCLLIVSGCSSAEPNVIVSGFAHPTAEEHTDEVVDSTTVGGVFLTIENRSSFPVRLTSATTAAANMVELHQSRIENDVMRMGIVENGIEIAVNSTLDFRAEGYHLMLIELTDELVWGDVINVTLTFSRDGGASFEVNADISVN
jgi:copper(I)-binding protein